MDAIFEIFSTREIATIIFITVLLLLLSFAKGVGYALLEFVKILANKFFVKLFITSAVYTSFYVLILYSFNLWNVYLFKDTCLWFLFSSLITVIRVHKAKDFTFSTKIIKDSIKIVFVYEFLVNLYTFSLTTELIIVSFISTLGILNVAAEMQQEKDPSVKKVHSCLNKAMIMVGVGLFVFTTYKTITEYKTIFTILTLKSFLLPILLIILSLPYFYALAMYMEYESLYAIVKHRQRYNSPKIFKSLIAATCIHANVNINKLGRVRKYYTFFNP